MLDHIVSFLADMAELMIDLWITKRKNRKKDK